MEERPARTRRSRLSRAAKSDQSPEPERENDPKTEPKTEGAGEEGEQSAANRRRHLRRRHHDQHPDYVPKDKEEESAKPDDSAEGSEEGDAARRRHMRRRHHDQHPDYVAPEKSEEKSPEQDEKPQRRPSKEEPQEEPQTDEKEQEKQTEKEQSKEEKKAEDPPRRQRRPRRRNADDDDAKSESSVRTEQSQERPKKIPAPPSEIVPADDDIEQTSQAAPSAQASAQATPEAATPRTVEEEEMGGERTVLQVTIHGTDELKAQMYLIHPVVKLSIVDTEDDGKFMKKPDVSRKVVSQYENVLGATRRKKTKEGEVEKKKEEAEENKKKEEEEKKGEEDKEGKKGGDRKSSQDSDHIAKPEGPSDDGEEHEPAVYDRILPVMTQPFDLTTHLKEGNPLCCAWDEAIGLDERLVHFMKHRYLFIFEVMDFIHTRDNAKANLKQFTKHGGWRKIAWAFLRPNKDEDGGYLRVGQRVRLQLYKYKSFWFWQKGKHLQRTDTCDAWHQWRARGWKPYKSTLSVTVDGIPRPAEKLVQQRAFMPWEREEGESELALTMRKKEFQEKRQAATQQDGALDQTRLGKKWIGATGKWCRVPNTPMHKLETDYRGCFVLAFSTFGTFLACAVAGHRRYRIRIFNVANGSEVKTLDGHYEIVYDMQVADPTRNQWGLEREEILGGLEDALKRKKEDEEEEEGEREKTLMPLGPLLVSASADTTARVWNVEDASLLASCHHPSYVYAARFCAGPDGVKGETQLEKAGSACQFVVTGCYDSNLRLWDVRAETLGDSQHGQIIKLVEGHLSHINRLTSIGGEGGSIVLDAAMTKLYSADGVGVIRVWSLARHSFDLIKEVEEPEVKGDAINCLRLDRTGKRLVLLARDNMVRMMDTERWQVTHRFSGLRSSLHQIRCDLSPDGKLLMSGSEDGQVFVWNTDTGEQDLSVPREKMPHLRGLCTDVAWNPAERIVACCSFSRKHPVLVHKYERDADVMAVEEMAEDEVRDVLQGQFAELAEAFKRMDKSGDGKLQLDEFRDGVMSLESDVTEMQIFRMFKTIAGGTDEIELDEFIRRFAPAGTAEQLKTNTAIEKARRRHSQTKETTSRKAATLGLLEELSSDVRRKSRAVGQPTESGHRRQLPPLD